MGVVRQLMEGPPPSSCLCTSCTTVATSGTDRITASSSAGKHEVYVDGLAMAFPRNRWPDFLFAHLSLSWPLRRNPCSVRSRESGSCLASSYRSDGLLA